MYFQTTQEVFKRLKNGIKAFDTIGEKRWRTDLGKKYAEHFEELIKCFREKLEE